MTERRYTIILQPDTEDGGFTVTVPTLPGCVTQGASLDQAVAMAREAIQLYIESLVADGVPVPEESAPIQALTISVAA
ncbi:MAG: type II toxin-antitoxin system HicB family antitoxin [Acidobacteria bacterium]|nr:type II toxin-antitoxin system HicB family antitoxin [Acidobacteriota bacterium]